MSWVRENKWFLIWSVFGIAVVSFVCYVIIHISKNDFNAALLQFGSILIPLFAAIIIMLQNNEQIAESTKIQVEHLQKLNDREIDELQKLFQKQIDTLVESTNKQIEEFRKMTNEQIKSFQETSSKQIQSNAEQTQQVVAELKENSVLLAEILKRQLEEAIVDFEHRLQNANGTLKNLAEFKLFRTEAEKKQQIDKQTKVVAKISEWLNYLREKYKGVKRFLKEDD